MTPTEPETPAEPENHGETPEQETPDPEAEGGDE